MLLHKPDLLILFYCFKNFITRDKGIERSSARRKIVPFTRLSWGGLLLVPFTCWKKTQPISSKDCRNCPPFLLHLICCSRDYTSAFLVRHRPVCKIHVTVERMKSGIHSHIITNLYCQSSFKSNLHRLVYGRMETAAYHQRPIY